MRVQIEFSGAENRPTALCHRHGDGGRPSHTCWVQPQNRRTSRAKASQNTLPEDDDARTYTAEKNTKIRSQGTSVS
jgi:hypothetical protein